MNVSSHLDTSTTRAQCNTQKKEEKGIIKSVFMEATPLLRHNLLRRRKNEWKDLGCYLDLMYYGESNAQKNRTGYHQISIHGSNTIIEAKSVEEEKMNERSCQLKQSLTCILILGWRGVAEPHSLHLNSFCISLSPLTNDETDLPLMSWNIIITFCIGRTICWDKWD